MAEDIIGRRLPFSLDAEQAVLGSLLIDPGCFDEIVDEVNEEDFYSNENKEIFRAMKAMYLTSRSIDAVTLIDELVKAGVYQTMQLSDSYIKEVLRAVPSSANVRDYARIVREKALLRSLISACSDISDSAFAEQDSVTTVLENAENRIFNIVQGNERKELVHIREVLKTTLDDLQKLSADPDAAQGTQTGFTELDSVLVGMGKGDVVIVGARPGMGKTSFVLNIATNVAKKYKKKVCVFSLEMSKEQLVSRMLSSEGLVDSRNIRSGKLSFEEWNSLTHTAAELAECDILIDDTSSVTISAIKAKLHKVKDLGLVIIDYLQLMQGESSRRSDSKAVEVGDISRAMKLMAKELGVPVICCAQLSRGNEKRPDKRPMLSELRDSGAIEQDADVVIFLYRDEYYKAGPTDDEKSAAEVIVAKNRHGAVKNVKVGWIPQYTKFISIASEGSLPE